MGDYMDEDVIEVFIQEMTILPKLDRTVKRRRRGLRVNSRNATALSNMVENTSVITDGMLAGTTPNIFKIGKETHGIVGVPNGWDVRRGIFNLILTEESDMLVKTIYISGYTEGYDLSYSGLFDDEIVFYMNKVYVTAQTKTRRGLTAPKLIDVFSVTDASFEKDSEALYLLRTEDALLHLTCDEIYGYEADEIKTNRTNEITLTPVGRSISEAVGARSIRKMLDNTNRTSKGMYYEQDDAESILTGAHNLSCSPSLNTIEFIARLSEVSNYNLVTDFTLKELFRNFGDFDVEAEKDVTSVLEGDRNRDVQDINDNDDYTLAANEIFYNISSIAAENMLTGIEFTADNLDGKPKGRVINADSIIQGINEIALGERVLRTFFVEIWGSLTNNNARDLEIVVIFSQGDGSKLEISFDGEAFVPFYMPTYLDSLLSPDIHTLDSMNRELSGYTQLKKLIL